MAASFTPGGILETFQSLPIYYQAAILLVAGIGVSGFLLLKKVDDEPEQLEATSWEQKHENMFKTPTFKTGRPVGKLLLNQTDSAGVRTMGKIKKMDQNETVISLNPNSKSEQENPEMIKKEDLKDYKVVEGVTYEWIEGRKKIDRLFSEIQYKIGGLISKGSNPNAEYLDIPTKHIRADSRGVIIDDNIKIFRKDGLWQTDTFEGQQRIREMTWLDTTQNTQEELQKLPEFYSDYNMKVAGKKNLENTKSQNMREYKQAERTNERMEAMEE